MGGCNAGLRFADSTGKSYEFTVHLEENGTLTFKWKCNNPVGCTGVQYQVWRKIGMGEFEYIGGCGSKLFIDNTVPAGSANITYQMQATRSTAVGPWAQFNVNFGVNGNVPPSPKHSRRKSRRETWRDEG
jgi:predicted secreted protein